MKMEICGEHGFRASDEIAHIGGNCPACTQIAELENEHELAIENLKEEYESKLDDLRNELAKARDE